MGKSTLKESAANSVSGPAGFVTDERADDVRGRPVFCVGGLC